MVDRERKRVPNHRPSLLQHHPLLKTSETGLRPSSTKRRIWIQLYKDGSPTDLQREGLRQISTGEDLVGGPRQIHKGKDSESTKGRTQESTKGRTQKSTKGRTQTNLQRGGLRQIYKGEDSEIYKGEDSDKSTKGRTQTNLQRLSLIHI